MTENNVLFSKDYEIAQLSNHFFVNITNSLNITKWRDDLPPNSISEILYKFSDYPSIIEIKGLGFNNDFDFIHVYPWEVREVILNLNPKKSTSGEIPTHILQMTVEDCCIPLTGCINNCFLDCVFPDELKLTEVVSVHKGKSAFSKENYRPFSLLPILSKVVEKLMAKRILSYFQDKLSPFLCGFFYLSTVPRMHCFV